MSLDKVQFFGAVDRKGRRKDGEIASSYPCWYFTRQLAGDLLPAASRPGMRAELEREKERLNEIEKAEVRLSGKEKDEAKGLYDDMAKEIGDSMFTYREMRKGFADPHEEVRRMKKPVIKVDSKYDQVMDNLGIKVKGGKISRDDATRVYQIIGKTLGENTNAERLRKDPQVNAYRSEVPLHELLHD